MQRGYGLTKRFNRRKKKMTKLVYKLTYPDGFERITEVKATIHVDSLAKVTESWEHLNIKYELVDFK